MSYLCVCVSVCLNVIWAVIDTLFSSLHGRALPDSFGSTVLEVVDKVFASRVQAGAASRSSGAGQVALNFSQVVETTLKSVLKHFVNGESKQVSSGHVAARMAKVSGFDGAASGLLSVSGASWQVPRSVTHEVAALNASASVDVKLTSVSRTALWGSEGRIAVSGGYGMTLSSGDGASRSDKVANLSTPICVSVPVDFNLSSDARGRSTGVKMAKSVCQWWDEGKEAWSTSGCDVVMQNSSTSGIQCCCNHLTTFSIAYDSSKVACGDGVKNASEACDDGNELSGDGCSSSCGVESGYSCKLGGVMSR